ncbi:hypothetical protein QBC35DRAFT_116026 [Podospora australis]|uniref:Secreted protein n=1 Tax=Podospora australis TaxID=1536484 RepID=A0AAN6WXD1_9PEZI|nr:hypothetical protein QBC35DRAFT_116026 [Podospora australis]
MRVLFFVATLAARCRILAQERNGTEKRKRNETPDTSSAPNQASSIETVQVSAAPHSGLGWSRESAIHGRCVERSRVLLMWHHHRIYSRFLFASAGQDDLVHESNTPSRTCTGSDAGYRPGVNVLLRGLTTEDVESQNLTSQRKRQQRYPFNVALARKLALAPDMMIHKANPMDVDYSSLRTTSLSESWYS